MTSSAAEIIEAVQVEVEKKKGASNSNLHKARGAKKDEFYTRLEDIENELKHYRGHFKDKTVFLNCDDPEYSNFWFYFSRNFDFLGLKRLIATHYTGLGSDNPPPSYVLELHRPTDGSKTDVENPVRTDLEGDGDFRSDEAVVYLQQSDIVVTNPPFSLYREYVEQLMEYEKKFIILGNKNSMTTKEIWPYIQRDELWLGMMPMSKDILFGLPKVQQEELLANGRLGSQYRIVDGEVLGRAAAVWFTNLDNSRRHEELILFRIYAGNEEKYPKYGNYDAINVDKTAEIPVDYDGVMGVPISFFGKYSPYQFEIIGISEQNVTGGSGALWDSSSGVKQPLVDGKRKYSRIFIKRVSE